MDSELRFHFPRLNPRPDPNSSIVFDNMYDPEPYQFLAVEELLWDIGLEQPLPQMFLYSFDSTVLESLLRSIRNNPLFAASLGVVSSGSETEEFDIDELEDVKVTLTEEQFDHLHAFSSSRGGILCTICQEESQPGVRERYTCLHCQHYYHTRCIRIWLTTQSVRCPQCRSDQRPVPPLSNR